MKKIITIATFILISVLMLFAQNSKTEQEILKIYRSLDEAFANQEITVFERVLADDYVYSNPSGKMMSRAESLEDMRQEFSNKTYKVLGVTSDDLKIKVSGNMALVTGNWTFTTVSTAVADAEPHKDVGRYTGVWEKRGGKWLLVAEHFSEAPHDRKLMEQQVLKAGQEYVRLIKNQDGAAIEKILADEYLFTNEAGKVKNKAEDVADYKSRPVKFEIFELSDQKVRVIGNGAAIETGTVRYKGVDSEGKSFDGSDRFTTTWVWRGGRWQIVADHTSVIK